MTASKCAFLYLNEKEKCWAVFFARYALLECSELLTMNYELLIAMSDSINHLKKLPVQLKNKSECIWKLLGDVWEV